MPRLRVSVEVARIAQQSNAWLSSDCGVFGICAEKAKRAMFKGFMDEARIGRKDRACVLAGFVGKSDECDCVTAAWRTLVEPLGEFHACDFFSRNSDGTMTGIYRHLSVSEAEATVGKLIDLLRQSRLEPIGLAIAKDVFMSLHIDERRWMTSGTLYGRDWPSQGAPSTPYFAPFHYCLTSANEYTPADETMHLTFHRQQQYEATARRIYDQLLRLGGKWSARLAETLRFSSSSEAILLQAADLLAYAMAENVLNGTVRDNVLVYALQHLGWERSYVRAMDVKGIDANLTKCPFRSTFWRGLTEPDMLEDMRSQGIAVLAHKTEDGAYITHHLKKEKIKVIVEICAQRVEGR